RRERLVDLHGPACPSRYDRRQPERPRQEARGCRVRPLHEVVRRAYTANRVPTHGTRAARPGGVSRPYGGHHPRDARTRGGTPVTDPTLGRDAGAHVAIIMDGNGRWANARGRPREWGHRQGARAVRRVV